VSDAERDDIETRDDVDDVGDAVSTFSADGRAKLGGSCTIDGSDDADDDSVVHVGEISGVAPPPPPPPRGDTT
jgi:hypothetical protein